MWVRSPGQEDPLEEGTAIHFSILAWIIPLTEQPSRVAKSRTGLKRLSKHEERSVSGQETSIC